jgi:hypothetical protein
MDYTMPPMEAGQSSEAGSTGDWFAGYEPEAQDFVKSRGWDSTDGPLQMLRAVQSLESLKGAPENKLLRIPDDPKDMGSVYARLGRPESPDKYGYTLPEGVEADPERWQDTYTQATKLAYDIGLSDAQLKAMLDFGISRESESLNQQLALQEEQAKLDADKVRNVELQKSRALAREWGSEYEAKKNLAAQTIVKLNLSDEFVEGLVEDLGSKPNVSRLLASIGGFMQESSFPTSGRTASPQSTEESYAQEIRERFAKAAKDPNERHLTQIGEGSAWNDVYKMAEKYAREMHGHRSVH